MWDSNWFRDALIALIGFGVVIGIALTLAAIGLYYLICYLWTHLHWI
jgi:hypothetical protein